MGQQQLLLVILVTIIVGIATVVAMNTFGIAADSANIDSVRLDITQIAAGAQTYFMKPEMLSGGGRSFDGIDFNVISFTASAVGGTDNDTAYNQNGRYVLTSDGETLQVVAHPTSAAGFTVGNNGLDGSDADEPINAWVCANNLSFVSADDCLGTN